MDNQTAAEHLINIGKVTTGGAATGGATYVAVERAATHFNFDVAQATAIAGLLAAVMTAVYFAISAGYAVWKWQREASGKE